MFLPRQVQGSGSYSIGLDASLSSFGCYFMPIGHDEWFGFAVQTDTKHGSDTRRILDVADEVLQSIAAISGFGIAVFEDYGPINRTSGKVTQRAEICGILKHALLRQARVPIIMVPPKSLKQFATDNGNASKDMMLDAAAKEGYYPDTSDEADAYFLAKIGTKLLAGEKIGVSFTRVNPDG